MSLCVGVALAFTAWVGAAAVAASGPLFVSPAGNDANDCQTFSTACRTISAAVGKALSGDTILIASGVYTESILIGKDLTLIGFGSDATIISGGGISQVLQIALGVNAYVYDVAVVRGYASDTGGIMNRGTLTLTNSLIATSFGSTGGGIRNTGTLVVNSSIISGNLASAGGGIMNTGLSIINNSSVNNNRAYDGGGLLNFNGIMIVNGSSIVTNSVKEFGGGITNDHGNLSVNNSVIANNLGCAQACAFSARRLLTLTLPDNGTFAEGAGINGNGGALTVTNSTISGNQILFGDSGGFLNDSLAIISNSTISANTAPFAAGIRNASSMTLTNVTLSGNLADNIDNDSTLWLQNTIVDNGSSSGCVGTPVISLGHNLDSANSCGLHASGDMTNTNPLLGPLQNNGGPTPTHALLPGSPAINHGDNADCPATDQRGIKRPQAGTCDIGAYEYVFSDTLFLPVIVR